MQCLAKGIGRKAAKNLGDIQIVLSYIFPQNQITVVLICIIEVRTAICIGKKKIVVVIGGSKLASTKIKTL